jgi:hypothetical protein
MITPPRCSAGNQLNNKLRKWGKMDIRRASKSSLVSFFLSLINVFSVIFIAVTVTSSPFLDPNSTLGQILGFTVILNIPLVLVSLLLGIISIRVKNGRLLGIIGTVLSTLIILLVMIWLVAYKVIGSMTIQIPG